MRIYQPFSATLAAGVSRRSFLHVGALTLGGLTLEGLLRGRAEASPHRPGS